MKKIILLIPIFIISKCFAQSWSTEEEYVQKFAPYAVKEMEKYNIPASITLAQGLLETGGGQSRLAKLGNNHFGIKCKENWTGKTMAHTDDAPNECFRVYNDPKESYEDHSKFLVFRKHYANLFVLDPKDYRSWAYGLKKSGYATNPKYAQILIGKIEKYRLYEFDNTNSQNVYYTILKLYPNLQNDGVFMAQINQKNTNNNNNNANNIAQTEKPATLRVAYQQYANTKPSEKIKNTKNTESINNILIKYHPNGSKKFIIIPANTNVSVIANKYNIREANILKWNDLSKTDLHPNDIIFLQSKSSTGNVATYKTESGDSMYSISQKFGIKLAKLYKKNRMENGAQPKVNQIIYLQSKKPRS